MTAIYFRVMREGVALSVEMEHLTDAERTALLVQKDEEFVLACLNRACEKLREAEEIIERLS